MKALINIALFVRIELSKALHHLKAKDSLNPCNVEFRMVMKRLYKIKRI